MRILLSNKYYYQRGGADIHSLDLEQLLVERGHEVAFFSMEHPLNHPSGYSGYFPAEVDYKRRNTKDLLTGLFRPFGTFEVRNKYKKLLDAFKPDIVHLHNVHTQLSPVLAVIAHKRGIPVVWTLHDHKLVCPRYDCMKSGKPCRLCFTNTINVIKYKCMKESAFVSVVAYLEAQVWNRRVIERNTDLFICPSQFLLNNMITAGYNPGTLFHLPNFVLDSKLLNVNKKKENYYCFVGRLSPEKGIETLLKAAAELPRFELRIFGTGPLEESLKKKYNSPHLKFKGFKEWGEFKEVLSTSRCLIYPSECFENNPLSIVESMCLGTPVIGSEIGGITELIEDGVNGLIYEPGNVTELKERIVRLFEKENQFDYDEIAARARSRFRSEIFYNTLMNIYDNLLTGTIPAKS